MVIYPMHFAILSLIPWLSLGNKRCMDIKGTSQSKPTPSLPGMCRALVRLYLYTGSYQSPVCGGLAPFVTLELRDVGHFCHSNPRWRLSFLQGLLGTFRHMRSFKMAEAIVNRYLWNPFYCHSNQYIDRFGHGFQKTSSLIFSLPMNFCFASL